MRRHEGVEYTAFQAWMLAMIDGETSTPYDERPEEERLNIDILINGPEQYGVEDQMMDYAKAHKNASIEELILHFDKVVDGVEPPDFGDEA